MRRGFASSPTDINTRNADKRGIDVTRNAAKERRRTITEIKGVAVSITPVIFLSLNSALSAAVLDDSIGSLVLRHLLIHVGVPPCRHRPVELLECAAAGNCADSVSLPLVPQE